MEIVKKMVYKERTDKTILELTTTKENFLPLSFSTFVFNNGDIYVECRISMKRFIIREGFIRVVEKFYSLFDGIQIAPKGDFGFKDLDNYNVSLNGIVFNGAVEVEEFLNWFDKVMKL